MRESSIVLMKFGSHLYGLDTPESDTDIKGIFMPTPSEILLGKIPKTEQSSTGLAHGKNKSCDIDYETYSLHYFLKLACGGQTVALDMLHAPPDMIISSSPTWDLLVKNRHLFYTKNLHAFVGYARKQASKYGIKGSRLDACKKVIKFLENMQSYHGFNNHLSGAGSTPIKLAQVWNLLPVGEHSHRSINPKSKLREYEVCGRKVQETSSIDYALDVYKLFYEKYGVRAKLAAQNQGIDWKAVSHAVRAAFEVQEILLHGTITFPLKDREYLKDIKLGKLDYLSQVQPRLEALMEDIKDLTQASELPLKVDLAVWDEFLTAETKWSLED